MHSISPFLRWPFTDITGGMVSHQLLGRCQQQEMDVMDCLEGYGLGRGLKKCKHLIEEFRECHTMMKQYRRFYELRKERDKQIRCGRLTGDEKYVSPRIDSY